MVKVLRRISVKDLNIISEEIKANIRVSSTFFKNLGLVRTILVS